MFLFLLFFLSCHPAWGSVDFDGLTGSAAARGVGHAAVTEAVYGGRFGDVLKKSLVSEASAAGFAFIGHNLYENPKYKDMTLPPKAVVHGLVGGVMARMSGGDFTSGAIATATAHVIGEELIGPDYADRVIRGEVSSERAKAQIDAIASSVAGAALDATRIKRRLKMAVYREAVKFTDEAYRTAYVKK